MLRLRLGLLLGLLSGLLPGLALVSQAHAALIAPQPGETVTLLEEHVMLVFDPLTGDQTIVVQHVVEGTSTPYGVLIPTPKPARAKVVSSRLRRAIRNRLHPRGRLQRTLAVDFVSWIGGCAVRDVGDAVPGAATPTTKARVPRAEADSLGNAPEPIDDWLLRNGLTLSPAQAIWLEELRRIGWSVTGVMVRPRNDGPNPPDRLKGPVIALTHPASEPVYATGHPPYALLGSPEVRPPIEIAVLTEWAVDLDLAGAFEPFYAATLTRRGVQRMSSDAGGLPWTFRRDGTLTAYTLEAGQIPAIIRFARTDPRPQRKPAQVPVIREHRLRIPIEGLFLLVVLLGWAWLRFGAPRRQGRVG